MKIAIVGAGLYGATVANLLTSMGHEVHVHEAQDVVGGNVRTEFEPSIQCHVPLHGAHIFHTNSTQIWNFITQFSNFNSYRHYVKGSLPDGRFVDLPFGMDAFATVLGITSPTVAATYLSDLHELAGPWSAQQTTVEGWCLAHIGYELYTAMVKNYTEKQWGRPCSELPAEIIKRLPIRLTYDTTYFWSAKFQGMPVNGYSHIIDRMLTNAYVHRQSKIGGAELNDLTQTFDHVFYSGQVDQLLDYRHGTLGYRGLKFVNTVYQSKYWNGAPVLNFMDTRPATRQIEHKLFYPEVAVTDQTLVTTEYPAEWVPGSTPYYPLRDEESITMYGKYKEELDYRYQNLTVGGRLGAFRYYDMDQVIGMAMADVGRIYK